MECMIRVCVIPSNAIARNIYTEENKEKLHKFYVNIIGFVCKGKAGVNSGFYYGVSLTSFGGRKVDKSDEYYYTFFGTQYYLSFIGFNIKIFCLFLQPVSAGTVG